MGTEGQLHHTTADRPDVVWPAAVTQEQALGLVSRRLPQAHDVDARKYHHPMLGVVLQWQRRMRKPMLAHVLVDLVGGHAYAADPWDEVYFLPWHQREDDGLSPTPAVISQNDALQNAQRLVNNVLLRRRKLEPAGALIGCDDPLYFGKPNWWVTGTHQGRQLEIIVDALTGKHYTFSA